eukprot:364970-Chlamydomonas_euryale.AAC.6
MSGSSRNTCCGRDVWPWNVWGRNVWGRNVWGWYVQGETCVVNVEPVLRNAWTSGEVKTSVCGAQPMVQGFLKVARYRL